MLFSSLVFKCQLLVQRAVYRIYRNDGASINYGLRQEAEWEGINGSLLVTII